MKNDFTEELKNIEAELLALKTASEYTSVRSANYTSTANVVTGIYRITYAASSEPIFSFVACGENPSGKGFVYARTPSANAQVIEAHTTYYDYDTQTYVTVAVPVSVVANRPVTSIEKIG